MAPSANKTRRRVSLALQGSGAHGAFTWGVLDRLLDDEGIDIAAISGTSSGAMNAVALAAGLVQSGRQGAREVLRRFWRAASPRKWLGLLHRTPWDHATADWGLHHSPAFMAFDALSRMVSPYLFNPANINPLYDALVREIDFAAVQSSEAVRLFISATNARSGREHVFTNDELTADAVMASASLPQLFQAVEINGEPYWDGGFVGNPALAPLVRRADAADLLIVQISPLERSGVAQTAPEILDRMGEIAFNRNLLSELRSIRFVNRRIDQGELDARHYRRMRLHMVSGDAVLRDLNTSSKLNPDWTFLQHLHDEGWQAADDWLAENSKQIGRQSTLDVGRLLGAADPASRTHDHAHE